MSLDLLRDVVSKKVFVAQAFTSDVLSHASPEHLSDPQLARDLHAIDDALNQANRLVLALKIRQTQRTRSNTPT